MEEFIITFWLTSTAILAFIISPLIVIGCGEKKPAGGGGADGAVGADGKPAIPTKACNTKSGLLNDDPDLKSDLLMAKPAAGAGGGAPAAAAPGGEQKEASPGAPPPA